MTEQSKVRDLMLHFFYVSPRGILEVSLDLGFVGTQMRLGKVVQTHMSTPGIEPITLRTGGGTSPTELWMQTS